MNERKLNLIEPNIAKLRQKRSWTQKEWLPNFNCLDATSHLKYLQMSKRTVGP